MPTTTIAFVEQTLGTNLPQSKDELVTILEVFRSRITSEQFAAPTFNDSFYEIDRSESKKKFTIHLGV